VINAETGPSPVDKPSLGADSPKSPGQQLLDRFMAQAKLVDELATELQSIRSHIDAPRALVVERLPAVEPVSGGRPQATSYFGGMGSIADFNDRSIARLTTQIAELKALF
jgi:hypothetical protein